MPRSWMVPLLALMLGCPPKEGGGGGDAKAEAQAFLDAYTAEYQRLATAWNEAEWAANTKIVEGDDTRVDAAASAREAYAALTGSVDTIEQARALLAKRD